MPHANSHHSRHSKRLDPRRPLVFDTRTLGLMETRSVAKTVPAPANLGVELVSVPVEAEKVALL